MRLYSGQIWIRRQPDRHWTDVIVLTIARKNRAGDIASYDLTQIREYDKDYYSEAPYVEVKTGNWKVKTVERRLGAQGWGYTDKDLNIVIVYGSLKAYVKKLLGKRLEAARRALQAARCDWMSAFNDIEKMDEEYYSRGDEIRQEAWAKVIEEIK